MSSKISQLTVTTHIDDNLYVPSQSGVQNYKIKLKAAIDNYMDVISTSTGAPDTIIRTDNNRGIDIGSILLSTGDGNNVIMPMSMKMTDGDGAFCSITPYAATFFDGETLINVIDQGSVRANAYQLDATAYVYNTGNLPLTSFYNGRVIVSNNGSAATITIASGLPSGFSCQVIQNSSGSVTFTGAAGVSMNSYGGLTQIAGRYGSAAIQYTAADTYVLAGNLA